MKGERPVPTEMVDNFRKALSTSNKAERSLRLLKAKKWQQETDIKKYRENMGYVSQCELARVMGISQASIYRFENKKEDMSDYLVLKIYDFLTNDLNRVIPKKQKNVKKPDKVISDEELRNWYNNFNFEEYLKGKGWHYTDLAKAIGYKSSSTVEEAIRLVRGFEAQRNALTRIYNYISKEEPITIVETTPQEITPLIEETYNKPLNLYTGEEEDIEVLDEEPTYEANVVEPIEDKPYVYSAEQIMISKKEYEEPIKTSNDIKVLEELNEDKKGTIMRLEQELAEARKQIARYEKLIDRM